MPVRAIVQTTATATSMPWVPLHAHTADADVGVHIVMGGTGDRTVRVDGTLVRVMAGVSAVPITLFTASATTAATVSMPLEAIRLVTTAGSGANNITMRLLQRGV